MDWDEIYAKEQWWRCGPPAPETITLTDGHGDVQTVSPTQQNVAKILEGIGWRRIPSKVERLD